jgi:hypothetical protein
LIVYAETSAVLSWLLGEVRGEGVRKALATADHVVSSDLTLIESDRALHRAARDGHVDKAAARLRRARLARVVAGWTMLRIGPGIVQRARQPFPSEPIRSLDAIHLASALFAREKEPAIQVVSLDRRVRENATELGFSILPD